MRNLKSYASNPFVLPKVSLDRKKKFGESHLANLVVQNTHQLYDEAIVNTIKVQQALFGNITNVSLNLALQQSQTQSVNAIMRAFKARNTRLNKHFEANDVHKTPLFATFFPIGVTEFTREVNKGNVEQLMKQMVKVISKNIDVAGGAAVLAEYHAFETQYKTTRGMQLTKIGEVSQSTYNRNASEAAWADQLFKNLLLISFNNTNNPAIIDSFFHHSI